MCSASGIAPETQVKDLAARVKELDQAKELVTETRAFLTAAPDLTDKTNKELLEIMMAQDFQDLTGQVIKRMMEVIREMEFQLLQVLLDSVSEDDERGLSALNGALAAGGCLIRLADHAAASGPVQLLFVSVGQDRPALISPRNVIALGDGARLTLGAVGVACAPEPDSLTRAISCIRRLSRAHATS